MQAARLQPEDVDRFVAALERRDRRAATRQALDLLDAGHSARDVILGLLAPAQAEVGRRWERNRWNVAQEHAATAITDAVLGALTWRSPPPSRGHVVVTCAEGEWHALAARLLAELLALDGWQVTFLGASTPAGHLRRFLADVDTVAVAVSSSAATTLGGAQRLVEAAHSARVPVLAGGAGFGPDERRARAIGADGWAPDAAAAGPLLDDWAATPPELAGPAYPSIVEHLELEAREPELVEGALIALLTRFPLFAGLGDDVLTQLREALTSTVQYLRATLLTGDTRLFLDEYLPWMTGVLRDRGLPLALVGEALEALATTLEVPFRSSADLVDEGRQLLDGRPTG
jgi:methanogenic corrinoid protein MtbC1